MIARLAITICATIVLVTLAYAQHLVDPHFDSRVEKPAYSKNFPRVLFDEAHYNFDTINNRYKPFADLMFNDGYHFAVNRQPFSKESLKTFKVLIITNALGAEDIDDEHAGSPAFSEAECDAVIEWLRGGGSLLFIAGNEPFRTAAESLAKKLGVEMIKAPLTNSGNTDPASSVKVFTRENQSLADHPTTNGRDDTERVKRVMSFSGPSLKGPTGSDAFLRLIDTPADATEAEKKPAPTALAQGLAFRLGKGRVVVLGDSAMLSAQMTGKEKRMFGMNSPDADNKQLALNIMHWLSGLLK